MILNSLMDYGKIHSLMDMDRQSIIMVTFIRDNLITVKDKEKEHIFLIESINTKDNGGIIFSGEKEKYTEINNYSFKDNFKMV